MVVGLKLPFTLWLMNYSCWCDNCVYNAVVLQLLCESCVYNAVGCITAVGEPDVSLVMLVSAILLYYMLLVE